MLKTTMLLVACLLISAGELRAQSQPATLATIFDDVFGPNGLVLSSDDVQLDGSNHAAHFNSAFQSDFRLMNIALTGQLTSVPLPSPASGFTYKFDPATGTFVRSTRSFGPILTDRGETIGRGRIAFGTNFQVFSFDQLDGVTLTDIPAVFRHDAYRSTAGRSDVIATRNTIEAGVTQFSGALTYGITDRLDVAVAVPLVRTRISLLSNATIHRVGTGADLGVHYFTDPAAPGGHGTSRQFVAAGEATGIGDVVLRMKGTVMREGPRALAAGVDFRMPSGDELNLLGAGALGVRPFLAVSSSFRAASPHLNVRVSVERGKRSGGGRPGRLESGPARPVSVRCRNRRQRQPAAQPGVRPAWATRPALAAPLDVRVCRRGSRRYGPPAGSGVLHRIVLDDERIGRPQG